MHRERRAFLCLLAVSLLSMGLLLVQDLHQRRLTPARVSPSPLPAPSGPPSGWNIPQALHTAGLPPSCPRDYRCVSVGTPLFGAWAMWVTYYRTWTSQFRACPRSRCALTANISAADAVVFHSRDLYPSSRVPSPRPLPHQVWVYFSWEAPAQVSRWGYDVFSDPGWRHLFNWTATYKSSADIQTSYGAVEAREVELQPQATPLRRQWSNGSSPFVRKHLAMTLVSNCMTGIGRIAFLKATKRAIPLHIFGKCGKKFPYRDVAAAAKDFYFIFAVENSRCKEYMTEKLWINALRFGIVPVVVGARKEDYEALAPPGSFVFAEDFRSPRALAKYLRRVAASPRLYARFFDWQRKFRLREMDKAEEFFCKLCAKLHKPWRPRTTDLFSVWSKDDCAVKPLSWPE